MCNHKLYLLYQDFKKMFWKNYADKNELETIFFLLLCHITGFNRTQLRLALINDSSLNSFQYKFYLKAISELKNNKPIQYILGWASFYGLDFIVNDDIFIPRPETEELIEWILSEYCSNITYRILDIGTGSGCIAIVLKKFLKRAEIHALDISFNAINSAKKNAKIHGVNINFHLLDLLKNNPKKLNYFDLIVSNPPYILPYEKKLINSNVLEYEPEIALFVHEYTPLIFYKTIALWGRNLLKTNGKIFLELNPVLYEQIEYLFKKLGFKTLKIKEDINGILRYVKIFK